MLSSGKVLFVNPVASGAVPVARSRKPHDPNPGMPNFHGNLKASTNDCAQCFVRVRAFVRNTVPQVLVYKPKLHPRTFKTTSPSGNAC